MLQIIEDAQDHWEHGYHAGNSRFEKSNAHIQEAEQVVRKTVKRPTFYWRQKERIHCKQIQIQIQMFQILEIKIQMLQKLRERMHSRQVYNQSVCNCHEDSELVRMIVTRMIIILTTMMIMFIRMMMNMIKTTIKMPIKGLSNLLSVVNHRPGRIDLLFSWQDKSHILLAALAGWENLNHNFHTFHECLSFS